MDDIDDRIDIPIFDDLGVPPFQETSRYLMQKKLMVNEEDLPCGNET